jgi:hypothetical protein
MLDVNNHKKCHIASGKTFKLFGINGMLLANIIDNIKICNACYIYFLITHNVKDILWSSLPKIFLSQSHIFIEIYVILAKYVPFE